MGKLLRTVVAVLVLLGFVGRARAEESAGTAYERGRVAYNLGQYAESLDALTTAYRLKPDAALLFNIAQCHRQLGHYADAARTYRSFLREQPDAPNRAEVERRIADMDKEAAAAQAVKPPIGVQQPTPLPRDLRSPYPSSPAPAAPAPTPPERRLDLPALVLGASAVVVAGVGLGVIADSAVVEGRANASTSITTRASLLGQADTEQAIGAVAVAVGVALAVAAIVRAVYTRTHKGGL